jgi:hypothetical protein
MSALTLNVNGCPSEDYFKNNPMTNAAKRRFLADYPAECQPIDIVIEKGGRRKARKTKSKVRRTHLNTRVRRTRKVNRGGNR